MEFYTFCCIGFSLFTPLLLFGNVGGFLFTSIRHNPLMLEASIFSTYRIYFSEDVVCVCDKPVDKYLLESGLQM